MVKTPRGFNDSVFINCPFDKDYWPIFEAIVFCIIHCRFTPKCALEEEDSGEDRLRRIQRLIRGSRYAIHDISRIEPSSTSGLPRFNMPFELGLDLGCRKFGVGTVKKKRTLILEAQRYRYRAFISDLAGMDIKIHNSSPERAIHVVRDWLRNISRRRSLPGPVAIRQEYLKFVAALPQLCKESGFDRKDLLYADYKVLAEEWVSSAPPI